MCGGGCFGLFVLRRLIDAFMLVLPRWVVLGCLVGTLRFESFMLFFVIVGIVASLLFLVGISLRWL